VVTWIEHAERVRDANEAAALLAAREAARVRMTEYRTRAWVVTGHAAIARVMAAVEPDTATTIAFECITRDATLPAFAELAAADAGFIHLAGVSATLRAWPRRGEWSVDEILVARDTAFARFRDACRDAWVEGYVTEPGVAAIGALTRALAETDAPVIEIDLDVALDRARELVLAFPEAELEWTGGDLGIQFPAGTLATYRIRPPEGFATAWRASVSEQLAHIRAR
jgi:hypothetical protein